MDIPFLDLQHFLNDMDEIADFVFSCLSSIWGAISSNIILFASFSLFLVSLAFLFFRKLKHII